MCREGRLYDVERWIAAAKPLQLASRLRKAAPHREDPRELDIALGYHVRAGNERGIDLCLWAGADPHAPAPNPELGLSEDPEEDGEA
jgi:hypothetical protein